MTWLALPEHHDDAAAEDDLRLVVSPKEAKAAVHALRHADHTRGREAEDILRAAQLKGLPRGL